MATPAAARCAARCSGLRRRARLWFALEAAVNWAAGGVVPARTLAHDRAARPRGRRGRRGSCSACARCRGGGVGARRSALGAALRLPARLRAAGHRRRGGLRAGRGGRAVAGWAPLARGAGDGAARSRFVHTRRSSARPRCSGSTFALDAKHASALRGVRLPIVLAALPLGAWSPSTGCSGSSLRRRGVRLGARARGRGRWRSPCWARRSRPRRSTIRVVTAVPPPAGTPDVFLISLDTTRADHLSTYGYERETSPNLDGARRRRAHLHAGALAGGVDAARARLDADRHVPEPARRAPRRRLAPRASRSTGGATSRSRSPPTRRRSPRSLRDRGYATGGFVANFSYLYRDFGLAQGFQRYEDAPGLLLRVRAAGRRASCSSFEPGFCLKPFRSARDINAAALAWLDDAPAGPAGLRLPELPGAAPAVAGAAAVRPLGAGPAAGAARWPARTSTRTRCRSFTRRGARRSSPPTTTARSPRWTRRSASSSPRSRRAAATRTRSSSSPPTTASCSASTATSGTSAACCTSRCCTSRWS